MAIKSIYIIIHLKTFKKFSYFYKIIKQILNLNSTAFLQLFKNLAFYCLKNNFIKHLFKN